MCRKETSVTLLGHFETDQFVHLIKGKTGLIKDAIPTIFAYPPVVKK